MGDYVSVHKKLNAPLHNSPKSPVHMDQNFYLHKNIAYNAIHTYEEHFKILWKLFFFHMDQNKTLACTTICT